MTADNFHLFCYKYQYSLEKNGNFDSKSLKIFIFLDSVVTVATNMQIIWSNMIVGVKQSVSSLYLKFGEDTVGIFRCIIPESHRRFSIENRKCYSSLPTADGAIFKGSEQS